MPARATNETTRSGKLVLLGKAHTYHNAKDAMIIVLRELAKADPSFLERCSQHPDAQGRKRRYIARTAEELYPDREDLRDMRETLPGVSVLGFSGVLNSTTNIILEVMAKGSSFEDGVRHAQKIGITEADPGFDIDGWDAAAKTAALANVLMDARTNPLAVDTKGIRKLTPEKLAELHAKAKTIRLVSRARRGKDGLKMRVRAEVLDQNDVLAMTQGTSSFLQIETDLMGTLGILESNPGVEQTAYGLFSDLVDIARVM